MTPQLFVGIPLNDSLTTALASCVAKKELLLREDRVCLHELQHQERSYVGKIVGNRAELSILEDMAAHITSVILCLIPSYPYPLPSPIIFIITLPST